MYRNKRAVAVLMCATFALVAAAPLAQSDGETTHLIYKDENGPPSTCAETWDFVAPSDGTWSAHVENNGMRWIILDMIDTDTNEILIDRDMYRWALYPEGWFDTEPLAVIGGHLYSITGTPNGPLYTSMTVTDVFVPDVVPEPPVAVISVVSVDYLEVTVSGAASYDPDGTIVAYDWDFGDSSGDSGMEVTHAYAEDGTYTITLTVTDDDGLTGTTTATVEVEDMPVPPVAAFTVTVDGLTVTVDASASSDDGEIVAYDWDFGDGSTGTGMIATHTYEPPLTMAPAASSPTLGVPPAPHPIIGHTFDEGGSPLPFCTVTITDVRLGLSGTVESDADGLYQFDLANLPDSEANPYLVGDEILVEAVKGALAGSATGIVTTMPFDLIDVTLEGETPEPFDVTITLTVTDDDGLTATISETVTLYP